MLELPQQNKAKAEEAFEVLENFIAEIVAAEILEEMNHEEKKMNHDELQKIDNQLQNLIHNILAGKASNQNLEFLYNNCHIIELENHFDNLEYFKNYFFIEITNFKTMKKAVHQPNLLLEIRKWMPACIRVVRREHASVFVRASTVAK